MIINQINNPYLYSKNNISFAGKFYPSGYYTDKEIEYAKKYLGKENWEEELRKERMDYCYSHMGFFKYVFTKAPNDDADKYVRGVRKLMVDLNNERIKKLEQQKAEARKEQARIARENRIKQNLYGNLVKPLQDSKTDKTTQVPTVALIHGSNLIERQVLLNWIKNKTDVIVNSFSLPQDEDDAYYRLETEVEYAQKNFDNRKLRTVLFIDNFDRILNGKITTPQTIGDMKQMLSNISMENCPITFVFATKNINDIDNAFLSNKVRIPYILDLDKI